MKRQITWRFDLTLDYDPRLWRWFLVLAMLLGVVGDLASESVTLTTYYPAPSGVYAQMITTGNTWLARDGGNVGIGTTTPATKLEVAGGITVAQSATNTGGLWAGTLPLLTTPPSEIRIGDSGLWSKVTVPFANVGIGTTSPAPFRLNVAGNSNMTGNLTVGGTLYPGCSWVAFGSGGVASCPGATQRAVAFNYTGGAFQPVVLDPGSTTKISMVILTTGQMLCCRIHE